MIGGRLERLTLWVSRQDAKPEQRFITFSLSLTRDELLALGYDPDDPKDRHLRVLLRRKVKPTKAEA